MSIDDSFLFSGSNQPSQAGAVVPPEPPVASNVPKIDDSFLFNTEKDNQAPKEKTIAESLSESQNKYATKANAILFGADNGFRTFTSTLAKLTQKGGRAIGLPDSILPDAAKSQQEYNHAQQVYQTDPSTTAHPLASILGNVGSQVLATAPLAAITGGLGEAAAGTFAGDGIVSGAGQMAARSLAQAVNGGIQGGLSNTPNQSPDQAWNQPNAKLGSIVGGLTGPVVSAADSFANKIGATQTMQNSLDAIGAKAKSFASDISGGLSKVLANGVLQKIPVVGTGPFRTAQANAIKNDIANYIGDVSDQTMNSSKTKIANVLDQHTNKMQDMENSAWNDFNQQLSDNNVIAVPKTNALAGLQNLQNYTNKPLSQDVTKDALTNNPSVLSSSFVKKINSIGDSLDPQDHLDLQRDIWHEYAPLQKKINAGTASTDETQAATALRDTYFNMKSDLQNAVQDTPAGPAYAQANAISQSVNQLYDPKYNKQLVNAIDSINHDKGNIDNYLKWMLNPNTDSKNVREQIGLLGTQGTDDLSKLGLKQAFTNSLESPGDNTSLNLSKFLNQYQQLGQGSQALIHKPALDQLNGLMILAKQNLQAQQSAKGLLNSAAEGAGVLGAGAVGYHNPVMLGQVLAGTEALSLLSRYAPVKNSLIMLNKASQYFGSNPELAQHMIKNASRVLTNAGVAFTTDHNGNTKVDVPSKQKVTYLPPYTPSTSQSSGLSSLITPQPTSNSTDTQDNSTEE